MDLGSGTTGNDNPVETTASPPPPPAEVTNTEPESVALLKLAIKTPKEKKEISIEPSATVKQVTKTNFAPAWLHETLL